MKQSGFLYELRPTDYILGSTSPLKGVEINPTGNWIAYLPSEERQSKDFAFDTMSCTTFSALNIVEIVINYYLANNMLTTGQVEVLNAYTIDGQVNFSDRFTAIMSGTMPQGNYFQNVWDSIRKDGLLPESDLPFGGENWNEYHDKSVITEEMKTKAKKILEVFDFAYEWVNFKPKDKLSTIADQFKQSPIHGAIPYPGTHAVAFPNTIQKFDTYKPFLSTLTDNVHYAMKGIITIKKEMKKYKYFSEAEVAKYKLVPELWELLDKAREIAGVPFVITSGRRTDSNNEDVGGAEKSAHLTGEGCDLSVKNSTTRFKIVNALLKTGFNRIGIYDTHIHCDISKTNPQNVMWTQK